MNPSSYSSIHTSTDAYSYNYHIANCSPTIPYLDHTSSFYEDPSSLAEGWLGEYVGPAEWSDADRALFEALVTVEVANTSPPSGSLALIPMPSSPSYSPEPSVPCRHTEAPSPYAHYSGGSQSYPSATVMSTAMPAAEQTSETSLHLVHPSQQDAFTPNAYSVGDMSQSFYSMSFPYPSPSPEPCPQASSIDIALERQLAAAHTNHSPFPLAFKQSRPEPEMPSISPDLIHLSAHCRYDLADDQLTDVSVQSSRTSRRATRRRPPSAPYPTPSPEPSPRISSTIFPSQRRNAPAPAPPAAAAASNSWQCPHCPYVQRNRRSPDLKRHVKTHTRRAAAADWVCCGVPALSARELGVPAAAPAFEFDGVRMVGGCRKEFSRRDALQRHLQREKGRCFGDASSLYQPGNRERR